MGMIARALAAGALAFSGGAVAQEGPDAPPAPVAPGCAEIEGADAFDFFVGDWYVYNVDGQYVGRNRIEKAYQDCFLFERWSGGRGGNDDGRSTSYLDARTGEWHQLWVSPNTIIDWRGAPERPGAMRLAGEIAFSAPARTSSHGFRGLIEMQDDGTLRQVLEWQPAADGEWQTWFDGTYRPVPKE